MAMTSEPPPADSLEAGRVYEAEYVPAMFGVWAKHLVEGARIDTGADVLDVACGTGVLARAAQRCVGDGGRVVGLDPAPGMLAAAAEIAPGIEWVSGRAEALPFEAQAFDALMSQFGIMFFPDLATCFSEMFRVLRPGGRLALAAWCEVDQNPIYRDIITLMRAEVSDAAAEVLSQPFARGDPGPVAEALRSAGFADIACQTLREPAKFPSPRSMVEADLRGWLPLFGIDLDPPQIERVLQAADAQLAPYCSDAGTVQVDMAAYVMTAQKP